MPVYWLIEAQDSLQDSLGPGNLVRGEYEAQVEGLSGLLEGTFPDAEAVLVTGCLQGYSSDPRKHALRVEVIREGVSRARIVKVGPPLELARELDGWTDCSRPSNERGRVFMELSPGKPSADGQGYDTLVYEDAQHTLRAAELRTLEVTVCNCARWGQPSAESLEGTLGQVFTELADGFYARGTPAPLTDDLAARLQDTLEKGRPKWREPGTLTEQCRRVSLALLPGSGVEFFDPVEYLPRLFASARHLPEVLRGPAHGDLHGRNILLGIVEGEALFPALFDYGNMARDSLPGWDFAKLETELKVRALQEVFAGDEAEFVRSVCSFEKRLAERTEENNNRTEWPRAAAPTTAEGRLAYILLSLRRQAKRCLETLQGRSRSWLHEYYFLLAVYGVYAGKFDTYRRRDAMAAFLCAGIAVARFAWAKSGANEQQVAKEQALRALLEGDATVRPPAAAISHHAGLAFAREWARSRREPFVEAAVEILTTLWNEYPCVLEIGQELALALLELGTLTGQRICRDRSEGLLLELDRKCPAPSMETLCRGGRLWKDRGDQLFGAEAEGEAEMSRKAYETALHYYRRAYDEFGNHYYPGINAATLNLLLGRKAEADALARAIIEDLDEGRSYQGDELAWVWATLGEAHLILGHCQEAAEYYRRAIAHPACRPHHVDAMYAQVKRILRVQPCDDVDWEALFRPLGA